MGSELGRNRGCVGLWEKLHADRETGQRTGVNYEEEQYVVCTWLPPKKEEAQEETEKVLTGTRLASMAMESDEKDKEASEKEQRGREPGKRR